MGSYDSRGCEATYTPPMRRQGLAVTLALLILSVPAAPGGQSAPVPPDDAAKAEFLLKAKVVRSRVLDKGVTNSVRATLSDGTLTHDAHVQTIDQTKAKFEGGRTVEIDFRDSWRFNVAAYRIDQLLSLNMVPVSVARDWRRSEAAYTWWVDDVLMDEEERGKKKIIPPNVGCWASQNAMLRMFDQLIDNSDRNAGNIVISNGWRVWGIDHTRAFRYSRAPRKPDHLTRIDRGVLQRLRELDFAMLKREVGAYVTDRDIRFLLQRRDAIVAFFENAGGPRLFDRASTAGCPY